MPCHGIQRMFLFLVLRRVGGGGRAQVLSNSLHVAAIV